jgi:hypothetical protein
MLEWELPSTSNRKWTFWINYSSLDLIQTCKRKVKFALIDRLRSQAPASALIFGSAMHKALETWYASPLEHRKKSSAQCDDEQARMLIENNGFESSHGPCARCSAAYAFLKAGDELQALPPEDKRSRGNGLDILNHYLDERLEDPFLVLSDDHGPVLERELETLIFEDSHDRIYVHGTIDMIAQDQQTKAISIWDHKTASFFRKDFFARIKPNFQLSLYWLLAQRELASRPSEFTINALLVAKQKRDTIRQNVVIADWELEELRDACHQACDDFRRCLRSDRWPMSTPGPCNNFNGCPYHDLCDTPPELRKTVAEGSYIKEPSNA